jgi:hypothetical protein
MRRPRLLGRTVAAAALTAIAALAALAPAAEATPLLPLAPGQLTVLLGQSGQWQPQASMPLTLALLAGPPRARHPLALTAYVALQPTSKACGRSPDADHEPLLDLGPIYAPQTLIANESSPLAPGGGAEAGVHAADLPGVIINGSRTIRSCTWLDTSKRKRAPATVQDIPLLNGVFAAAVWATGRTGGPATGYTLDAMSIGNGFQYAISGEFCGQTSNGPQGRVAADQPVSFQFSISSIDCPVDGTTFTFSGPGGSSLGSIPYSITAADTSPPTIGHAGGCDLNGAAGLSLSDARRYVTTVGCAIRRVLTAPHDPSLARGVVTEAQVDGGIAPIAPAGTAVDLVVNG